MDSKMQNSVSCIYQSTLLSSEQIDTNRLKNIWKHFFSFEELEAFAIFSPPTQSSLLDIEWNAKEALRLNSSYNFLPSSLSKFFIARVQVNKYMLFALKQTTNGWSRILHPDKFTNTPETELRRTWDSINTAVHWHRCANLKLDSLIKKSDKLQQFSIRQWRFYDFMSNALHDLIPVCHLVDRLAEENKLPAAIREEVLHVIWHSNQLLKHFNYSNPPSLKGRLLLPQYEITRLLCMTMLFHSKILKLLLEAH